MHHELHDICQPHDAQGYPPSTAAAVAADGAPRTALAPARSCRRLGWPSARVAAGVGRLMQGPGTHGASRPRATSPCGCCTLVEVSRMVARAAWRNAKQLMTAGIKRPQGVELYDCPSSRLRLCFVSGSPGIQGYGSMPEVRIGNCRGSSSVPEFKVAEYMAASVWHLVPQQTKGLTLPHQHAKLNWLQLRLL